MTWIAIPLGSFLRWIHLLWAFHFIRGHSAVTISWYAEYGKGRQELEGISRLQCSCGRVFYDEEWVHGVE